MDKQTKVIVSLAFASTMMLALFGFFAWLLLTPASATGATAVTAVTPLSVAGCSAPTNGQVLTIDTTNFCVDYVDINALSSATLSVDQDGVQVVTNVVEIDFQGCLTVATDVGIASVTFDHDRTACPIPFGGLSNASPALDSSASGSLVQFDGSLWQPIAPASLTGVGSALILSGGGETCTNQFLRAIANDGTGTCETVALTTDTSGNYVETVATGVGLSGGQSGSEGAAIGLSLNLAGAISDGECLVWATPAIDGQACGGSSTFPVYSASSVFDATAPGFNITTDNLRWITGATPTLDVVNLYYQTVDDEDTPLTQRATLNFEGAGVECVDDTDQTTCTIAGGAAQNAWYSAIGTTGDTVTADSATFNVNFTSANSSLVITSSATIDSLDFAIADITGATLADDRALVGNSSNLATPTTLPNCASNLQALNYNTSTNAFSCRTITFSNFTLSDDNAWIGSSGSVPTATTLPSCSNNRQALNYNNVTNAITCRTIAITNFPLTDDSVWVGSASALAAAIALPSCSASGSMLRYNTTTNAFSCDTNAATATALASNPGDCAPNTFAQSINTAADLTCSDVDLGTADVTGTLDVGDHTNLAAGDYAVLTGDTLSVNTTLATWSWVAKYPSTTVDQSDIGNIFPAVPATISAFSCVTTTGTATVTLDIYSYFTDADSGKNTLSGVPCTTTKTRYTTFTYATVTADEYWNLTIDAVSDGDMLLSILPATGTKDA